MREVTRPGAADEGRRHASLLVPTVVHVRGASGVRGWAGKPLHPPLTDIPVGAYVLAAAFDVISFGAGDDQPWARDFYRARVLRAHRRRDRLGARGAHWLLGLAPVDRTRHASATHGQRPRVDDGDGDVARRRGDRGSSHLVLGRTVDTTAGAVPVDRRRGADRCRRRTGRHDGVRLRVQRRDRRRQPGVAPLRVRRAPRSTSDRRTSST